jgi:hypothetical protein
LAKEVEKAIAQARTINLLTRIPLLTSNGRSRSPIVNLESV